MAKIIHEAGGYPLINGVKFEPNADGGWVSEDVSADKLADFDGVPGYRVLEQAQPDQKTPAKAEGKAAKGGKKAEAKAEQPAEQPAEQTAEQAAETTEEPPVEQPPVEKGLKA